MMSRLTFRVFLLSIYVLKVGTSLSAVSAQEQIRILAGREFQLEEREDKDMENTLIVLNLDGTVSLHDTDGPQYKSYSGEWMIQEDDKIHPFRLRLDRTFTGGMDAVSTTDIGEFDYQVSREFWGNIQIAAGGAVIVEGVIHLLDTDASTIKFFEVGYFALIDSAP
jgi:hypothetical protein